MTSHDGDRMLPEIVQEALSRIKVLLDTLFETADDAIFLMDGMRFVDCNPATLRMYGCKTKGDILGETPVRFSPDRQPDGARSDDKARELVAAAMAGSPQHFEWRHCRLDRTEFDAEVSLNRCLVEGTRFVVAVVRDITARKRAETALLHEKQFVDGLIESLPGTFYLFDSELRLRRWCKHLEVESGYAAEELRGKRLEDWPATEEERERVLAAVRHLMEHGDQIEIMEVETKRKDGSIVPYLVSGARIDSPEGHMLVGMGIDLTARVQTERALAASERNYRELFDATNDGLFIHDEAGRVLDVNVRACEMFGLDAATARGAILVELSPGEPPYSQRDAADKLRRAISEGTQVFDWQSRRGDGTTFWAEVALRPFRIEGEVRVIASVRDVTDRKLAGLERERLLAELQAANSAKDQFLAVLSHELRNPLAAIQAGVDLLQHLPGSDQARTMPALRAIERNVKLQTRLVNDLLDLSRLMRGKLTLERTPVQLDEVAAAAAETCRADAERARVSLEVRAEPGLWVDADPARLQQMVMNLVDNAIKFTPNGGRVAVSVTAKERHGYVVVEDTGVGIDRDRLSSLFEMFRQGEIAAHRAPGLGIGLALVRSIADLHGGRVWAESAGPGRGSRFIVELPLCDAPADRAPYEASVSRRAVLKVLLVEDNSDTRSLLAEALSHLDYTVVPAESAEAGLDVLAREPVDAIIADMGLPGMDGYEFLRRARLLRSAAHVPAFALTGYGQESDLRRAREAGYVDHFVKPANTEVIDHHVRARVGRGVDEQ